MSLAGRTLVLTRPIEQSKDSVGLVERLGGRAIVLPTVRTITIVDPRLDQALAQLMEFELVVVPSVGAFRALEARAHELDVKLSVPFATVGEKTAKAIEKSTGRPARFPKSEFHGESLVRELAAEGALLDAKVLLIRAPEGREELGDGLRAAGCRVVEANPYRIAPAEKPPDQTLRELEQADAITFMSGLALEFFFEVVGEGLAKSTLDRTLVGVIGPVTKQKADELGVRVDVVPEIATAEALIQALADRMR
ncbi:MAG: uroporphyrinogen-III synthase [Deltaproteobacteria bacterium]|nr:uroporphyrinogen-III synthase [Deltaproteobacteria bacterium]